MHLYPVPQPQSSRCCSGRSGTNQSMNKNAAMFGTLGAQEEVHIKLSHFSMANNDHQTKETIVSELFQAYAWNINND